MRILMIVLAVLLLGSTALGDTVSDLITNLRIRANETDSTTSNFTNPEAIVFLNNAMSKIVTLGGLLEKSFDTTYQRADSLGVILPTDFRRPIDVKIYLGRQWEAVLYNPGFQADTDLRCFDIDWIDQDSAMMLWRGQTQTGVRIRLSYYGVASELVNRTDTVRVRSDMIPFIVEEAYSYYLESLRMIAPATQKQQTTRIDMGLRLQGEVKQ